MKDIPTIDCMIDLRPGGLARARRASRGLGWLRDPESALFVHGAEHLFKDAPSRTERGVSVPELLSLMDEVGVEMGLLDVDLAEPGPVLEVIEAHPARFFGEVSVSPFLGMPELRKLERLLADHPCLKACSIAAMRTHRPYNDRVYWPLYAKCVEMDLPLIAYVGLPGPRVPGAAQTPVYLDEVLWFFPDLRIVLRHGGEPWVSLCVEMMLKWPNLYYSTSAFSPRHIPGEIVRYMNTSGAERVLYAGYYPGLDYRRVQREIEALPLMDHVWPLFLRENARRVFKLGANDIERPTGGGSN